MPLALSRGLPRPSHLGVQLTLNSPSPDCPPHTQALWLGEPFITVATTSTSFCAKTCLRLPTCRMERQGIAAETSPSSLPRHFWDAKGQPQVPGAAAPQRVPRNDGFHKALALVSLSRIVGVVPRGTEALKVLVHGETGLLVLRPQVRVPHRRAGSLVPVRTLPASRA